MSRKPDYFESIRQRAAGRWVQLEQDPDRYTLLLVDADDTPLEITGRRLREMCDGGELTLYPAKYRLVYENGKGESDA